LSRSIGRDSPPTYHLTPAAVWEAQARAATYRPEGYDSEGFIHCTDGESHLLAVGDRYYRGDRRDYVVLSIARERITAPVKYEDPERNYPHIYGPLNTDAVVAVRPVVRDADGAFVAIGE
jgi:uncharacterized protein (DUF952 family)